MLTVTKMVLINIYASTIGTIWYPFWDSGGGSEAWDTRSSHAP